MNESEIDHPGDLDGGGVLLTTREILLTDCTGKTETGTINL